MLSQSEAAQTLAFHARTPGATCTSPGVLFAGPRRKPQTASVPVGSLVSLSSVFTPLCVRYVGLPTVGWSRKRVFLGPEA